MKRNHVFAPYVFAGGVDQLRIRDMERITHLNFAFMLIKDGKGDLSHIKPGVLDSIRSCKKINPDLKLIVSIGGWGAGGFSNACLTDEGIDTLARSTVELAMAEGFDGVDVDWEYPCSDQAEIDYGPHDKVGYTKFMQALRKYLDEAGPGHILTTAVGSEEYYIEGTEMDKVAEVCDYVNLMTYDMRGGFTHYTGHHAAPYGQTGDPIGRSTLHTIEIFHNAGVPYEKLVVGSSFGSRSWSGCNTWVNNGLGAKATRIGGGPFGGYDKLKDTHINKNGFTRFWDDQAKAAWLYNGDTFVTYEDPDSLREKIKMVKEMGLAGIMYWAYGGHSLFEVIAENLD